MSLTTDIQQEGESGPLIEPCSRGKTSPQPQGTKEGTGEAIEPEDSSPQDAQVRRSDNIKSALENFISLCVIIIYLIYEINQIGVFQMLLIQS